MTNLKDATKSIYPKLKQSYEKIFHQAMDILETLAKLANIYLNAVLDLINQHQKEINDTIGIRHWNSSRLRQDCIDNIGTGQTKRRRILYHADERTEGPACLRSAEGEVGRSEEL